MTASGPTTATRDAEIGSASVSGVVSDSVAVVLLGVVLIVPGAAAV